MATLKYFEIISILIFISYTGGGATILVVSSFVLFYLYIIAGYCKRSIRGLLSRGIRAVRVPVI